MYQLVSMPLVNQQLCKGTHALAKVKTLGKSLDRRYDVFSCSSSSSAGELPLLQDASQSKEETVHFFSNYGTYK
jgi:hypothetical protein